MQESYSNLFASWEISVCKSLIAEFQQKYPWLKLDFDDLLQECLIHWHEARATFTAEKTASLRTYMNKVIRNKLNSILKQQLADKRKLHHFAISLDQPTGDEEVSLGEVIADTRPSLEHQASLRLDVTKVVGELGPFQQRICQLLSQGYSIRDIAGTLGKSKSTVHREIRKIRRLFTNKGLDKYLS